jgi:PAS domain S-box-containing protein
MLLESIPSSVLLIDRSLRVIAANRNFLTKAHRTEKDTLGMPFTQVFPQVILDSTDLADKIQRVFELGELTPGEQFTYRAPSIPPHVYYYTVVPIKSGTTVHQVMLLMDDITERVRLIEKTRAVGRHLASVVESANDLVISADVEGRIVSWNGSAERISGYQADDVAGRPLAELCDPAQRREMAALVRRVLAGNLVKSQEVNLQSRSGALVPVAWSCSPMGSGSGKPAGLVAVGRDLSERRAFEAQLFQSEKLAALGVMAGGIAHELRNPLSASFSAAQFLREGTPDQAFRAECLEKILTGIQKASTIIENLLRFARPPFDDRMGPVNLVATVRETIGLLTHQAKLQKITLEEEYPGAEVPVIGNVNLLQQVVMNLVMNAYHAMPTGGRCAVSVRQEDAAACVSVRDNGCGIPPSHLARIFDPFFTTRPVGSGTGLGLSLCYTIVKQHQGRIDVESVVNQGSTFTLRLPLAPAG